MTTAISHPGSGCSAWDLQEALTRSLLSTQRCQVSAHGSACMDAVPAAAWPPQPTVLELGMLSLLLPKFIPPDNLVSHGRTWTVAGLAAPRDAACQGLALAQPRLLLVLTDISHNPGPSSAGLGAPGGCGHQPRAVARLQGRGSALAWPGSDEPKVCCRQQHCLASAEMRPACSCAPAKWELCNPCHAQRHCNARRFGLSKCKSHPQPHLPRVRLGQRRRTSCTPRK